MEKFLVMWCNGGLETLINLTARERENILAVLQEQRQTHTNPIQYMILRAQANIQRHYEIYAFESEIPEASILEMFEDNPQAIVDAIRRIGVKIYSDRKAVKKDIIT